MLKRCFASRARIQCTEGHFPEWGPGVMLQPYLVPVLHQKLMRFTEPQIRGSVY